MIFASTITTFSEDDDLNLAGDTDTAKPKPAEDTGTSEENATNDSEVTLIDLKSDSINYVGNDWKLCVYAHFEAKSQFDIAKIDLQIDKDPIISYDNVQLKDYKDGKITPSFIIATEGLHYLKCNAYDTFGNKSLTSRVRIYVDATAPYLNFKIYNIYGKKKLPPFKNEKGLFVSKKNEVEFEIIDNISKKFEVFFSDNISDSTADFKIKEDYNKTFSLVNEKWNVIRAYAKDQVGNTSKESLERVYVDDKAPIVTIQSSYVAPILDEKNRVSAVDNLFTINVTDEGSGINKIYFRVNDSKWALYSNPIMFSEPGDYKIYVRAFDNVGNTNDYKNPIETITVTLSDLTTFIQKYKKENDVETEGDIEHKTENIKKEE